MIEPTKREMDVLRALFGGSIEGRGGLPFIGVKTIADLLAKGWIDEVPEGAIGQQMGYRITEAGEAARSAGRTPKQRKPPRLKTLRPSLENLRSRFRSPD